MIKEKEWSPLMVLDKVTTPFVLPLDIVFRCLKVSKSCNNQTKSMGELLTGSATTKAARRRAQSGLKKKRMF